ncbi:MAG: mannose-1-phosphate guanylyltransferase [Candidatus Binatia bacterium]|nr:MAG: mannose-1-phosphate guanylyltransferase [Candidatus Binatia bacterium]
MTTVPCYGVVMAGGHGTRFWPLSRERRPKQFLSLDGRQTLLRQTARRLVPLVGWQRLLVVTHKLYARQVRAELPELPPENVLAEPEGKNTLPCLLFAAAAIRQQTGNALMIAVPADHVVRPASDLRRDLRAALALARQHECLVTLGVPPTRVETGYGYIEIGQELGTLRSTSKAYAVRRFREKPDRPTARRFLRSGRFLWNSGMFVWDVQNFWRAAELSVPSVAAEFGRAFRGKKAPAARALADLYRKLPHVSVDQGVLEPMSKRKAVPIAVVPASFAWSDVGSWTELGVFLPADSRNNVIYGPAVDIGSRGNVVWSPRRLVALVGMQDTVVVDTEDALLVCRKEDAQSVREVIRELKRRRWSRYL